MRNRQPSAPGIPSVALPDDDGEEPLRLAAKDIQALRSVMEALTVRVGSVDLRVASLESDIVAIRTVATTAGALMKNFGGKAILAVVAAVAGAVGVTRATEPDPKPPVVIAARSAFDRGLDACKSLPDTLDNLGSSPRERCIVGVVRENVPVSR